MKVNPNNSLAVVFFHEVGHFFAHRLNEILYKNEEVTEVLLEEVGTNNFVGKTNIKWKISLHESAAQRIAGLVYGCIFQGLAIQNEDFKTCFGSHNPHLKGIQDKYDISEILEHLLERKRKVL